MERSQKSARKKKKTSKSGNDRSIRSERKSKQKKPAGEKSQKSRRTRKSRGPKGNGFTSRETIQPSSSGQSEGTTRMDDQKDEKKDDKKEEKKEERKEEKKEEVKEPWSEEEPAKRMVANGFFTTTNVGGTFKQTDNFKTPMDSCPSFKNNMHKIRAPDCPIPEEKLVKLTNGPESFICAAKITVPDFNRTMILTQVPDLSSAPDIADFWRMIHQESIASVVIAVMPLEVTLQQILPLLSGTYSTYGKMFVNNKKVESAVGMTEYCLEIFPDGCSNSLLTTVYHLHNWRQKRGLEVVTDLVATMEKVMKVNDNTVLMSMNGTGRAGTMLTLFTAMLQVQKGKEVNAKETLASLRAERCGIVDNIDQFGTVHRSMACWFKNNSTNEEVQRKVVEFAPSIQ
ncbi:Putative tyrosine-protein phosphatase C15H7.3 [Caenorhabditis elegans]|uniref:Putative tyrosine-protein phosphatase C15H7.3 n=1 Tax=Caenorhabditis elegans TaxID=6239 RepID=YK13_CAEEL|nr:Putative tyrosine-protein phosphatase C15H7.3 [Caenorhabditis elegans]P34337.1 RecName: Full=Putative tyrosine-protein phosphatase C15H7.3 [Caenorhabditis elegans]CAA80125.1 Putative tyrosine-protein phosphatase C15H7.3 [Caenorhabditis elegans]|eukprot:NP_499135.1 Putative tyrosine-protein phosphatase C15H7.3 [Caenorhabditis elegans]